MVQHPSSFIEYRTTSDTPAANCTRDPRERFIDVGKEKTINSSEKINVSSFQNDL